MRKLLYNSVDKPVEELATLVYHHFGKAPMGWTGIDKLTEYAHNEQFVERVLELYHYVSTHDEILRVHNHSALCYHMPRHRAVNSSRNQQKSFT